ncbi:MAG: cyclic nucleotide-binding domain-containing protein [Actinomycetota bacterium]
MKSQISRERIAQLRAVPLFSSLNEKELAHVDQLVDDIEVEAGEVLIREGQRGMESFVVLTGNASVSVEGDTIAELAPGEMFGEMAVLGGVNSRTATVTSLTPMQLLVITPVNLVALLEIGGVASELIRTLVDRLRAQVSTRSA